MSKSRKPAAANDPLEQNLVLARRVVEAAQEEMINKARQRVPALRLGAVAGAFGVMATAATYRMNVLLLERKLPPELASFITAAVYGGGAGAAAMAASRKWKGLPAPLPTDTAPAGGGDPHRQRLIARGRARPFDAAAEVL
ncbi:hypothetical protein BJY14_005953 [Actinomadura luteofluorescens]|uniref:Uncharacterized protein n=1 Tax=Actinomadura luteofluorescens TaxID=46163 RepID=A0A7Y9EMX7_9ACTN|nr:phage holin family protein [Actinomadura luteofluorescens]NYD49970.1 hypothetical protein [Actinomadura luteofluorescens]